MAASDAKPIPTKNTAYRVTFPIFDADGDLVTGAAGLDSEYSIDGGAFADCTSEAVEIAAASGIYYLDLTAGEMNGDTVAVIVKTTTVGAKTTPIILYPAESADIPVNVTAMANNVVTAAAIATGAIDADALAADAVDEIWDEVVEGALTARQLLRVFLSALAGLSSGGGTVTIRFRDEGDSMDRIVASVDANGNRTAIALDGS
jgi:hypothetical protein